MTLLFQLLLISQIVTINLSIYHSTLVFFCYITTSFPMFTVLFESKIIIALCNTLSYSISIPETPHTHMIPVFPLSAHSKCTQSLTQSLTRSLAQSNSPPMEIKSALKTTIVIIKTMTIIHATPI